MDWRALFLWAGLCFVPATARAEEVRLAYTRLPGAESCPTKQTFRDLVAAQRGGLDPFTDRGPRRMVVTIARRKGILQGKLVDERGSGKPSGIQEISGPTCDAVVDDLVLLISLFLRTFKPPPDPPPPPSPAPAALSRSDSGSESTPVEQQPKKRVEHPSPTHARSWLFQVGGGPVLVAGFSPAPSLGFAGLVGASRPVSFFAVGLEGRGDLPRTGETTLGVSVRTSFAGGSLVPCYQHPWVVACGVVTLGRLQSTLLSAAQSSFYAGTGARVGLVVPLLAERLSMGLTGDLLVNLTRPSTQLGGATVWSMAPVSGLLGLRLDAFF